MPKERLATNVAIDHESASDSDEALMVRICAGDKGALGNLFRRYARLVRAVGFRILRDTSEADDLVQDVFVFIHRTCRRFDSSKSTARSWVVQMTYQRAIDRRRYLMSRHFYSRADLDDSAIQLVDPATEPMGHEPVGGDILGREGRLLFQRGFDGWILVLRYCQSICKRKGLVSGGRGRCLR